MSDARVICTGATDGLAYEVTEAVIAEAKEYHFRVDGAGYRPFSTAQARHRFGDEAVTRGMTQKRRGSKLRGGIAVITGLGCFARIHLP